MIKNVFAWLVLALPLVVTAQEKKPFIIKGTVKNISLPGKKVAIIYTDNGKRITDTAIVVNNEYTFTGNISEPLLVQIHATYHYSVEGNIEPGSFSKETMIRLYLSPGTIEIVSDKIFGDAAVTGSKAHDEYIKLLTLEQPLRDIDKRLDLEYGKAIKEKNEQLKKSILDKQNSLLREIQHIYKVYLKANPSSPVAIFALNQFTNWAWSEIDLGEALPLFNSLPLETKQSPSGKTMAVTLETAKRTSVGQPAPGFTLNDTLGLPVALSSFRGKYVLIDFWASWCGPCREESPYIIKAFDRFRSKGLTVLGVSLDMPGQKDRWIEAIHQDSLVWTQVSELNGWDSKVAVQYGLKSIPQNFLLDPKGVIVAKNLYGMDIEKKLSELFRD